MPKDRVGKVDRGDVRVAGPYSERRAWVDGGWQLAGERIVGLQYSGRCHEPCHAQGTSARLVT